MNSRAITSAIVLALLSGACDSKPDGTADPSATTASQRENRLAQVSFTDTDLDKLERGLRKEIEAVKAAQVKASSATTPEARGEAIQAQWDTATIPQGAEASGLSADRYREIREAVDSVFTTLDFQGKIDGPLSIDLERADAATKARVSGDAFAPLPAGSASALRTRMDRLVPIWSEYKALVAVGG